MPAGLRLNAHRTRSDRCPGALRPWPADDGLLVRLRLIGGRVESEQLAAILEVAERFGDGRIHVTSRANLQLRALQGTGQLDDATLAAIEATGLLPTRTHELVRNIMISPQTGLSGGRAYLRPTGHELDRLLCTDPKIATLSGRFLFVLDDGRGDLMNHACDLGLVALDGATVQVRVGEKWGPVVDLDDAAQTLADLATAFVDRRGTGPTAPWHVRELAAPLVEPQLPDPRVPPSGPALAYSETHVEVPGAGMDRDFVEARTSTTDYLIVTPWRGVLIPKDPR
ncbi:MAG: nitrite reductase [Gordonia sp. (in: high G+C Gram-positive bacteria)]|uniref:nitrite reductase n=1 Tax=Gordonia sp. (in: high G+C Gram-positive bacteria) TaxID=84139 RepID=UPI003C76F3D4